MTSRMEFRNYRSSAQLVHCNIHQKRYSDVPWGATCSKYFCTDSPYTVRQFRFSCTFWRKEVFQLIRKGNNDNIYQVTLCLQIADPGFARRDANPKDGAPIPKMGRQPIFGHFFPRNLSEIGKKLARKGVGVPSAPLDLPMF